MGVAQLVEPRLVVPVVAGSSPVIHPSQPGGPRRSGGLLHFRFPDGSQPPCRPTAAAYVALHHLGLVPAGIGPGPRGTRWLDWIDLAVPWLVVGLAALAVWSSRPTPRVLALLLSGAIAYTSGHGAARGRACARDRSRCRRDLGVQRNRRRGSRAGRRRRRARGVRRVAAPPRPGRCARHGGRGGAGLAGGRGLHSRGLRSTRSHSGDNMGTLGRQHGPTRRGQGSSCPIQSSTSSAVRGRLSERLSDPRDVTTMSSSMRMPMPRSSSGTSRSSAWK